jgi:hypothetical protein
MLVTSLIVGVVLFFACTRPSGQGAVLLVALLTLMVMTQLLIFELNVREASGPAYELIASRP